MWSMEVEAERLRRRFESISNKAKFARQYKVPGGASMLSQHLSGHRPMNLAAATAYATGFGVPLEKISPRLASQVHAAKEAAPQGNTSTGPSILGLVPLISSVQAGQWTEINDSFATGDAKQWLSCPTRHGPNTFCLKVEGQSMSNPNSKPSYEEGDIIFVDPDRSPTPGDRVVVRLEGQERATFKQYLEEDGRKLLKALNPDWKPKYIEINGDATICGVVIGKWVPE